MDIEYSRALGVFIDVVLVTLIIWVWRRAHPVMALQEDTASATGDTAVPLENSAPASHSPLPSDPYETAPNRRLMITGCKDPSMWYAQMVGREVPYLGYWVHEGFKSREPAGYINLVQFSDAYVIDLTQEQCEAGDGHSWRNSDLRCHRCGACYFNIKGL